MKGIIIFGIGAFDENAVHTGSSFAKKQSWTSPEKAIMGGAKFVRKITLIINKSHFIK